MEANVRDCEHGHLRRSCKECYLLFIAKECVGWDATPEEAMCAQRDSIVRLKREVEQLRQQHEFDIRAKDDLRLALAKAMANKP